MFNCVLIRLTNLLLLALIFLFCACLVSCDQVETLAPVAELNIVESIPKTGIHRVLSGETLYEIAWRYGLDYRDLANQNDIQPPYAIFIGQTIYLRQNAALLKGQRVASPSKRDSITTTINKPKRTADQPVLISKKDSTFKQLSGEVEPNYLIKKWAWPTKKTNSAILQSDKGVNIIGHLGEAIFAAGPGKVVYAGSGLRSYGNLIIIKHNSLYLSAYAHNNAILVREGDWVKKGQKIAEMGNTGSNKVMLHFEIRRGGRPLNLSFLSY